MVVTDGFFNNPAVRRELDQKYPTLRKQPNPENLFSKIRRILMFKIQ